MSMWNKVNVAFSRPLFNLLIFIYCHQREKCLTSHDVHPILVANVASWSHPRRQCGVFLKHPQGWAAPPGHLENSRWAARTGDIIIVIDLEKNVMFAAFLYYINTVSMGKQTNIFLVHINSYSLCRLPK